MKRILVFNAFFMSIYITAFSQQAIDVTDQTIKIGGNKEEELLYGFAQGDKIIFNFLEENKKDLNEIEIIEYPNNAKFSDYKTHKIENKILNVTKQGVYKFRFKNSTLGGRICRIQIQRIPANESTINFNTSVKWITKQDTIWDTYTRNVIVGYDTTYEQRSKLELVRTEKREELLLNKTGRVHSQTNGNGSKTFVYFSLPQNTSTRYNSSKVIAWAYWIGVDDAGNKAWEQNAKTISTLAKGVASVYTTPLGALAVGAITNLIIPTIGEDVQYWIADKYNKDLFMAGQQFNVWDKGKGVAGYKKFSSKDMCQGTYYILLSNDNIIQGINANIKVIAIVETKTYEDIEYTEQIITPKMESKIFKDPIIKSQTIPITGF